MHGGEEVERVGLAAVVAEARPQPAAGLARGESAVELAAIAQAPALVAAGLRLDAVQVELFGPAGGATRGLQVAVPVRRHPGGVALGEVQARVGGAPRVTPAQLLDGGESALAVAGRHLDLGEPQTEVEAVGVHRHQSAVDVGGGGPVVARRAIARLHEELVGPRQRIAQLERAPRGIARLAFEAEELPRLRQPQVGERVARLGGDRALEVVARRGGVPRAQTLEAERVVALGGGRARQLGERGAALLRGRRRGAQRFAQPQCRALDHRVELRLGTQLGGLRQDGPGRRRRGGADRGGRPARRRARAS